MISYNKTNKFSPFFLLRSLDFVSSFVILSGLALTIRFLLLLFDSPMCSSPPHCFDEQIIEENYFTEPSLPNDALLDQFRPPLNNLQEESVYYELWGSNQDYFPNGYTIQTTDWIMRENNPTDNEDEENLEENQDMFMEGDYLELNDLEDYSSVSEDLSWYNNQITGYSATFTVDILM